jgi:hypothetical protein
MALGVTRITNVKDTIWGNQRVKHRHLTFDSSYPAGGLALKPSDVGLKTIDQVIVAGPARKNDATSAVLASYDHTNGKVLAFWSAGSGAAPTQVTATTDLSTYTARVTIIGSGTG